MSKCLLQIRIVLYHCIALAPVNTLKKRFRFMRFRRGRIGYAKCEPVNIMGLNRTGLFVFLVFLLTAGCFQLSAQDSTGVRKDSAQEVDVMDILRKIFKKPEP